MKKILLSVLAILLIAALLAYRSYRQLCDYFEVSGAGTWRF